MSILRRKGESLAPLDPYLGRRQTWSKQAEKLLDALPDGPLDGRLGEAVGSIGSTFEPVRSVVARDRSVWQTLGSRVVRKAREQEGLAISWSSLARQPRLASLPILVRKTVIELRPLLGVSSPVPDRLEDCFDWLRGTLIACERPVLIVWDGLDLANRLDDGGSWFWFTSPWPSHVRLVTTLSPSPMGDSLADRWARADVLILDDIDDVPEDAPLAEWSKRARDVAGVLLMAPDGRTEAELASILPAIKPADLGAALAELRPWLSPTEEDRWILARLPAGGTASMMGDATALKQTIDYLQPLGRKDRSVEAELLGLLVRSDDPSHRQATRRHLQSHPLIWHLWSRDRADLYEMARTWEASSVGAWQHLTESARTAAGVEPHHLVAYGDVLESLGKLEEARQVYLESAERASDSGAVFHEQTARRRAADCSLRLRDFESVLDLTPAPAADVDLRQRGVAMILRAEAMAHLGQTEGAWETLSELEKQSFDAGSAWHQIESLSRQATLAEEQRDETAAANIDAQILILGRTAPVGLPFVQALARETKRKLEQKDESTAQTLAEELHRSAVLVASAENVGLALGMLASLADRRGAHEEAAQLLAGKEKLCRQVGDLSGAALTMVLRAGIVGLRLGQSAEARQLLEGARRIVETIDHAGIAGQIDELTRLLSQRSV